MPSCVAVFHLNRIRMQSGVTGERSLPSVRSLCGLTTRSRCKRRSSSGSILTRISPATSFVISSIRFVSSWADR
jgi:hypothetical protein